ncbi:hypothetical protein OG539_01805 [Actinacidiphila glaucinigra]|uniref:hypothetical protein n=1 Tax=Actinacidiphila glaucinigra TaxID=235986 RepID=UPI003251DB12
MSDGLRRAAYLHLGAWGEQHESEEPQAGLCPAVRVFDWLFYIGTIPSYQAPRLDAELSWKLLDLYKERPGDLPSVTAGPADLRAFIERHQGKYLLMEEQPPQVGKPCN